MYRQQYKPSNLIISQVIVDFLLDPMLAAAILDLCKLLRFPKFVHRQEVDLISIIPKHYKYVKTPYSTNSFWVHNGVVLAGYWTQ